MASPIHDKPMTNTERSQRKLKRDRQQLFVMRGVFDTCSNTLLEAGRKLTEQGEKDLAHNCFVEALTAQTQINIIDHKLDQYWKEFGIDRPDASAERESIKTALSKLESDSAQAAYQKKRASHRLEIEKRYGHLAKAEKAESHA